MSLLNHNKGGKFNYNDLDRKVVEHLLKEGRTVSPGLIEAKMKAGERLFFYNCDMDSLHEANDKLIREGDKWFYMEVAEGVYFAALNLKNAEFRLKETVAKLERLSGKTASDQFPKLKKA
jgi:hypothetical protein